MESEAAVSSNMICMKCHIKAIQAVSITTTWYHTPAPREEPALRPTCEGLQLHSEHKWKSYRVNLSNHVIAKKINLNFLVVFFFFKRNL